MIPSRKKVLALTLAYRSCSKPEVMFRRSAIERHIVMPLITQEPLSAASSDDKKNLAGRDEVREHKRTQISAERND